jgi:CBS domain-containing protein
MDDWIEEDLILLGQGTSEKTGRVLDQHTIREPIRVLNPQRPIALAPEATIAEAIQVMRDHRIGCVLVVENERLIGIFTERDVLQKVGAGDLDRPVGELMTPEPEVLVPEDPIVYALNKMSVGGFRHVPLVDGAGQPVGIVSVKDIVDYLVGFFANDVLTVPPDMGRGELWRERDGG